MHKWETRMLLYRVSARSLRRTARRHPPEHCPAGALVPRRIIDILYITPSFFM